MGGFLLSHLALSRILVWSPYISNQYQWFVISRSISTDVYGMPLDREFDLFIDLESGTRPISIPSYQDSTSGILRYGIHLSHYFTLGCSGLVCEEEGW